MSQHSWKRFLYPPRTCLFKATKSGKAFEVQPSNGASHAPYAFIGVRSCDLHAMGLLDKVFRNGEYADPGYVERRTNAFIVAVQCTEPAGTCFCSSMNTGPRATGGFDIALTELVDGGDHLFLAEGGTERGRLLLASLSARPAGPDDVRKAEGLFEQAGRTFSRQMPQGDKSPLVGEYFDHGRWDDIAKRCLSCANCTHGLPDLFLLDSGRDHGPHGGHARSGGAAGIRASPRTSQKSPAAISGCPRERGTDSGSRTSLSTGSTSSANSGCVGCGRCITWCPAHIDITAEAAAFIEPTVISTNTQGG